MGVSAADTFSLKFFAAGDLFLWGRGEDVDIHGKANQRHTRLTVVVDRFDNATAC